MLKKYNKFSISKFLIFIIMIMIVCFVNGCDKDDDINPDDNGIYTPDSLVAEHTIFEEDLDLYLLVQGKPNPELEYSITIYSDFKKENRTSRHYSYYQIDFETKDNVLEKIYHFFDYVTDGTQRSYAQNVLPYNKLSDALSKIKVKFEYSFMIEEVVYEKECLFEEEMLTFSNDYDYQNVINDYTVLINKTIDENGYNRYKLSLNINHQKEGHLDFTAFALFSDGNIYPLYGLYHYNFQRGNYLSTSDTKVSGTLEIEKVYYVFKECLAGGTINYQYYMY